MELVNAVVTIFVTLTPLGDFQALAYPCGDACEFVMFGPDAQDLALDAAASICALREDKSTFRAIIVRDDNPSHLRRRLRSRPAPMHRD